MDDNNIRTDLPASINLFMNKRPLLKEFVKDQLPLMTLVFGLGVFVFYFQNGLLPGDDTTFQIAGVKVPVWHLL